MACLSDNRIPGASPQAGIEMAPLALNARRINTRTARLCCSRFAVRSAILKWFGSRPPRVSQRRGYRDGSMNFLENFAHSVSKLPSRIMRLKLSHVADPPDVVADAVGFFVDPG